MQHTPPPFSPLGRSRAAALSIARFRLAVVSRVARRAVPPTRPSVDVIYIYVRRAQPVRAQLRPSYGGAAVSRASLAAPLPPPACAPRFLSLPPTLCSCLAPRRSARAAQKMGRLRAARGRANERPRTRRRRSRRRRVHTSPPCAHACVAAQPKFELNRVLFTINITRNY